MTHIFSINKNNISKKKKEPSSIKKNLNNFLKATMICFKPTIHEAQNFTLTENTTRISFNASNNYENKS